MESIQSVAPIQPLSTAAAAQPANAAAERSDTSMFTQIFQSMVDNVKQTDAVRNEKYYALVTGQLDNPAEATIAANKAVFSVQLLTELRNKALDAYSEIMRISI